MNNGERMDFWKMIVMAAVASGRKTATEACQMADTALAELIIRSNEKDDYPDIAARL